MPAGWPIIDEEFVQILLLCCSFHHFKTPVKPSMQDAIQLLSSEKAEKLDFDWGGLTWYASGSLGNSSELTVGNCRLRPGRSNPRHYHPNCSEILVVMQGNIRHTMADGSESEMKP